MLHSPQTVTVIVTLELHRLEPDSAVPTTNKLSGFSEAQLPSGKWAGCGIKQDWMPVWPAPFPGGGNTFRNPRGSHEHLALRQFQLCDCATDMRGGLDQAGRPWAVKGTAAGHRVSTHSCMESAPSSRQMGVIISILWMRKLSPRKGQWGRNVFIFPVQH